MCDVCGGWRYIKWPSSIILCFVFETESKSGVHLSRLACLVQKAYGMVLSPCLEWHALLLTLAQGIHTLVPPT